MLLPPTLRNYQRKNHKEKGYGKVYHTSIILLSAIQDIPEELYESAITDGAGGVKQTWYITVPMMRPVIQIGIIPAINGAMQGFDFIKIMTNGGPGYATQVPATWMFEQIFQGFKYGYGTTIAITIFLVTFLVSVVFRKLTSWRTD
jgi:raffinose/stachyose/melibiose transport system permease protein